MGGGAVKFTEYGKDLARNEQVPPRWAEGVRQGASRHAAACKVDSGLQIVLTGVVEGRPVRKEARSVLGAWATAQACYGVTRAWHVTPDGKRRLVFVR